MSNFIVPPESYGYMQTADVNDVKYEWFILACHEYIAWQRACGVVFEPQVPEQFCKPGDLQTLANVVNWWPKNAPPRLRAPTLGSFMDDLKTGQHTFESRLGWYVVRIKEWITEQGGNVDNPNETAEERAKRKNRERQRAWQLRHAEGSDDPELHALIQAAKHEAEQLSLAKAWLKGHLAELRSTEQAAIAAAKAARANGVSAAEAAVADQQKRMLDAKALVDAYKARK